LNVNLNDIIGKLGVKIANLEIQLAHAQAANEAYLKRIKELEEKISSQEKNAE